MPVSDLIRQLCISEQTFYRWKKLYGGLQSDQVRELKQLQEENARLKKVVAERTLDKAILQDVVKKSCAARAETPGGALPHAVLPGQRATGLPLGPATSQRPVLRQLQGSSDWAARADAGDRTDTRSLRLWAHSHAAAPRWVYA